MHQPLHDRLGSATRPITASLLPPFFLKRQRFVWTSASAPLYEPAGASDCTGTQYVPQQPPSSRMYAVSSACVRVSQCHPSCVCTYCTPAANLAGRRAQFRIYRARRPSPQPGEAYAWLAPSPTHRRREGGHHTSTRVATTHHASCISAAADGTTLRPWLQVCLAGRRGLCGASCFAKRGEPQGRGGMHRASRALLWWFLADASLGAGGGGSAGWRR